MLDSLVRVSRRVLKVPKAIASPIDPKVCPRTSRPTVTRGQNRHWVRSPTQLARLPRVERSESGLKSFVYRRASQPGHAGPLAHVARTGSTASRRPTPNGSRRPTRRKVHAFATGSNERKARETRTLPVTRPHDACGETRMNFSLRPFGFLRFTPKRFHVLLNSLFKVLFNFPSRYLFAIGLVVIFSLRWSLPPT